MYLKPPLEEKCTNCDVDLVIFDPKQLLPILEESNEVSSNVYLIVCLNFSLSETSTNRLINPKRIRLLGPSPRILYQMSRAWFPIYGTVFLEEACKRATPRTPLRAMGKRVSRCLRQGQDVWAWVRFRVFRTWFKSPFCRSACVHLAIL